MPKLDWIGKEAVVRHHLEVPYRLVHCNGRLSAGAANAQNLLVQGDNLEALRALLPYYAGKVKCIYIDPPYNTGNEGWVYNDKVNSPQIRRWLDKVVGNEAEDLCRHDKWLCMMYPRLRLLREFLREDGVIFVSIDDNEQHRLHMMMDEIFGENNLLTSLTWRKKTGGGQDSEYFAREHEYIISYRKSNEFKLKFRTIEVRESDYRKEKEGRKCKFLKLEKWGSNAYRIDRPTMYYAIKDPDGHDFYPQAPDGRDGNWRTKPTELDKNHIHWERNRANDRWIPYEVVYWDENTNGCKIVKERTILYDLATTTDATNEQKEIFGEKSFSNNKPIDLVLRLVLLSTEKNDIILDSFAGSGTTAHAVLQQNKEDGGNRKFILVEMDEKIARDITAKRIQKAIKGYTNGNKITAPLGDGFRFCTLGKPLFDENGNISPEVKFSDLAAHIFFSATGTPIPKRAKSALLGTYNGYAVYLLYNGIMGDKSKEGGNMLTTEVLRALPKPPRGHVRVVYGEGALLSKSRMEREKVIFCQIPYQINGDKL